MLLNIQDNLCNNKGTLVERLLLQKLSSEKLLDEPKPYFEESEDFFSQKKINRLQIMLQTDCNLKCKYCYADGGTYHYGKKKLSSQQALLYLSRLILNKIKDISVVFFFGGEPSLCPDTIKCICEYITELVEQGFLNKIPIFTMVTNGVVMSDLFIQLVSKYNIRLTLSMDGIQEIHDQLRIMENGNGSFELIQQNLERLKQAGIQPVMIEGTYTTLHQKYGFSRKDVENQIEKITGVKNIFLADCTGESEYAITHESLQEETIVSPILDNKETQAEISIDLKQRGKRPPYQCPAGFFNITLTPDGKLYPCHMFLTQESYCLGEFIDNEWNMKNYTSVKMELKGFDKQHKSECSNCWARWLCRGCPATMYQAEKKSFLIECQAKRKKIEYYLLNNDYLGSSIENKKNRKDETYEN